MHAQIPQVAVAWLADVESLIFTLSAHTGPDIVHLGGRSDTRVRIPFNMRVAEGAPVCLPTLTRAELLVCLKALADDMQLQIVELLAQWGEVGAPDIIAQPQLSQSSASRHVEHVAATGCVTVRCRRGTHLYRPNLERTDYTSQPLKQLCQ